MFICFSGLVQGVAGCLSSCERMGRWSGLVGASLSRRLLLLDGDHVALGDVHRVRVAVRVSGILEKNFVILLCSYRQAVDYRLVKTSGLRIQSHHNGSLSEESMSVGLGVGAVQWKRNDATLAQDVTRLLLFIDVVHLVFLGVMRVADYLSHYPILLVVASFVHRRDSHKRGYLRWTYR